MAKKQKRSNRSKLNRKLRQAETRLVKTVDTTNIIAKVNISVWKKISKASNRLYAILGGISLIIGLYLTIDRLKTIFRSDIENYNREAFVQGILMPQLLFDPKGKINVMLGSNTMGFHFDELKQGVKVSPTGLMFNDEKSTFNLKIKIINNRLFFSRVFNDLINEQYVGELDYNKWKFFKPNFLFCNQTDSSFEVLDKAKNIMFSILYIKPGTIKLQGYSINEHSLMVVTDEIHPFLKEQKNEALIEIHKIRPINNDGFH